MDSDDRRQSEREFPRRTMARIEMEGTTQEFQILDESEGGLGVYVSTREEFLPNTIVAVSVEADDKRSAVVRYVFPHPNGGYQVGLKWV